MRGEWEGREVKMRVCLPVFISISVMYFVHPEKKSCCLIYHSHPMAKDQTAFMRRFFPRLCMCVCVELSRIRKCVCISHHTRKGYKVQG